MSIPAPLTSEEVEPIIAEFERKQSIKTLTNAFSGDTFFSSAPYWYAGTGDSPASRLISAFLYRKFSEMDNHTKTLLWRACLEKWELTEDDFPYPFSQNLATVDETTSAITHVIADEARTESTPHAKRCHCGCASFFRRIMRCHSARTRNCDTAD